MIYGGRYLVLWQKAKDDKKFEKFLDATRKEKAKEK